MHLSILATLILLLFSTLCPAADERVALVIGNNAYQHMGELGNPQSDAQAAKAALDALKFDVDIILNATAESFHEGLEKLKTRAAGAELALVYFAGHGVEIDNKNYLLPVDAELVTPGQLQTQAINLDHLLAGLEETRVAAKVVILDCCRDDPLSNVWMKKRKVAARGLAELKDAQLPSSTLVMFSAGPGQVAEDGVGANSAFNTSLVKHLIVPDQSILNAFFSTSDDVMKVTNKRQTPWVKFDGAGQVFRELAMVPVMPPTGGELDRGSAGAKFEVALPAGKKMEFRFCPAGFFRMGSPPEEEGYRSDQGPTEVRISQGFWMGATEVTQDQWQAVAGRNPSHFRGNDRPVENVSWTEAVELAGKLNEISPQKGWMWTLPTEAQWEYACRAGSKGPYHGELDEIAWHSESDEGNGTRPVRSLDANRWNLHDTHGNVWEWCLDGYRDILPGGVDPFVDGERLKLPYRVARGGGYADSWVTTRAAWRFKDEPDYRSPSVGIRLAIIKK